MTMKNLTALALLLCLLIGTACSDDNDDGSGNKEDNFSLHAGEPIYVEDLDENPSLLRFACNRDWEITEKPDWLVANPMSGKGGLDENVILSLKDDLFPGESEGVIKIRFGKREIEVSVMPFRSRPVMNLIELPPCRWHYIHQNEGTNDVRWIYEFSPKILFVTAEKMDNIFVGALVKRDENNVRTLTQYTNYTPLPIKMFSKGGGSTTMIPSKAVYDEFADRTVKEYQGGYENYFVSSLEYNTYRELNLSGMINLGLPLEEIIKGKPYQELPKVVSGKLFYRSSIGNSIHMTMDQKIMEQSLDPNDFSKSNLSVITSVAYGNMDILLVESDYEDVISLFYKILNKNEVQLSAEEKEALAKLDAYHVYYDQNRKIQVKKGKADAIVSYSKGENYEYPMFVTLHDYFGRSDQFSYNLNIY